MAEKKEYKGLWWLPEASDKQVPGILVVEKSKISLETIGVLGLDNPLSHFADRNVPCYDVIWGISLKAKEISIFNCHESISLNTSSPFALAHYSVQVVAVGRHIASLEELGNYDVTAYIEELSYWFKPNCLHSHLEEQRYTCSAELENTPNITVQIEDGCSLKIEGEAQFFSSETGMRMEFEQKSSLNFIFSKPISIRDAKHKVFLFEQFLSFATLTPVWSDRLLLIDKDKKLDPTENFTIEIYDDNYEERTNNPERFWKYLFVYDTIANAFPSIIRKWYVEKEMSPIRAHLIDSVRNRGVFSSVDFLIVVQAVEGYYSRFIKDGPGLRDILLKLKEKFSDITILELSNCDINCICDSRNYYSHLLPTGKKTNVKDGIELYKLNHKLRKILLCCLLNFVGFNNEEINKIFKRSDSSYLRMIGDVKSNAGTENSLATRKLRTAK